MIIAEFCQNHDGNKSILKKLIIDAGRAGAHFCKIQSFFANDLSSLWRHEFVRMKKLELDWQMHSEFVRLVKAEGMTPMTSVYSAKYLKQIKEAGFEHIKVGSGVNPELIPVIMKEAHSLGQLVSISLNEATGMPNLPIEPFAILHCVSLYPTPAEKANLLRIQKLRTFYTKKFPKTKFGFSSHIDPGDAMWYHVMVFSKILGAEVIEAHFTVLNRSETKDGKVSIDLRQLKDLVEIFKKSDSEISMKFPYAGIFHSPTEKEQRLIVENYYQRWKNDGSKVA